MDKSGIFLFFTNFKVFWVFTEVIMSYFLTGHVQNWLLSNLNFGIFIKITTFTNWSKTGIFTGFKNTYLSFRWYFISCLKMAKIPSLLSGQMIILSVKLVKLSNCLECLKMSYFLKNGPKWLNLVKNHENGYFDRFWQYMTF